MTPARRGGKRVGYIRVSSLDQNEQRQLEGVEVDKKFTDKASGKDANRPQLKAALDYLRDGDVLVVHSMDRLARNITDLLHTVEAGLRRGHQRPNPPESKRFLGAADSTCREFMTVASGARAIFVV